MSALPEGATEVAKYGLIGDAAFFSWLGVTMYLETEVVLETLRAIYEMNGANAVTFDYAVPRETLGFVARLALDAVSRKVAKAGEPFRAFFAPAGMAASISAARSRPMTTSYSPA